MLQERKDNRQTVKGKESAEIKSLDHVIFNVLRTKLNALG